MSGAFGLLPPVSVGTVNVRGVDGVRTVSIDSAYTANLECLGSKRVLLFICCNDSGTSLTYARDYLRACRSPPAQIRTAALYSSLSPSLKPRYVAVHVGLDTNQQMNRVLRSLPWVTKDWRLVLPEERHSARK
jgi:hypoxanthine phosphoribosyltransferase